VSSYARVINFDCHGKIFRKVPILKFNNSNTNKGKTPVVGDII